MKVSSVGPQPAAPPGAGAGRDGPRDAEKAESQSIEDVAHLRVQGRRRIGTWISGGAILCLLLLLGIGAAENKNFGWDVVGGYLFDPRIRAGLVVTIWLTVAAMSIGIVLGIFLAIARNSRNVVIGGVARVYIWFFRGTPVLVQLIIWYNLAALVPYISIGVPFAGAHLVTVDVNEIITPLSAALLGLGLNEGAYMAEIVRAGVNGVDRGQIEAGRSVGLRYGQILRAIVLPQAMRVIIPPTGNEVIGMLKTTSLVSVIALADLLYAAQSIYSVNFQTIPLLIVICFWYLLLTTILSAIQSRIERKFSPELRRLGRRSLTTAVNS